MNNYKIRWWWNRFKQSWLIQVLDNDNNEIKGIYAGNKASRDFIIKELMEAYSTSDARKYKKGE